ncbi:MAG: SUMF1/EgtB/PvdO family nonheme iron enzyme [Phycisphaerae bacterium]|jgi:formylglycine-generating enzyme required for sulfatase activity|nr:SUMF1/EgtB/PvdO family nonheme iron enzyme [Phycisphaerae bacterium]
MADDQSHNIQADSVGKTACHKCGSVVDVSSEPAFSTVTCPKCGAQFTAPGKLGGFVLLKELGKGEMGATYKAYEKSLGRYVAIKVMHGDLGRDPSRVESFMSEGRALASLDNPNIVRVFSLGQEKDQTYIAMELIAGGGMEKQFSRDKPLDEVKTLEIITGVARALRAAGEIGLIHGDVKPENIMLNEKGRPKLVDFGIARFGGGKIAEGDALGTPYYVAPEQVERATVDHRADIYSLGATMYHALAGEAPFTGDSLMKVLYARIEGPVPDISKVRPSLHPETVEVLTRMLQKDPGDRYATYDELLKDLLKACWAAGAEIIQDADEAIPVAEKLSGPDWSKVIWIVVGLGAVAAGVVIWAVFFRASPPPKKPVVTTQPAKKMKVADPRLSRLGGALSGPAEVTISCNTPGARIHYTTDGSIPTTESPLYSGAITVTPGKTLKARAFRDGWDRSAVVEAEYTRDEALLTDAVDIRGKANAAWERAKKLDPKQGFAAGIDQGVKLHSQASDLYDKEAYAACKAPYSELLKLCDKLILLDAERQKAKDARSSAQAARKITADAGSKWVKVDTRKLDQAIKQAQSLFDRGEFAQAQAQWKNAEKNADAGLSGVLAKTAEVFQNTVKRYDVKQLDEFGGAPWTQAKTALENTRTAKTAEQRLAAARACAKAIESLTGIARSASEAARKAAANAANASKAAEIKKRLADARKLTAAGHLRKALEQIKALQKLDRGNRDAQNLKTEIEKKMKFSLYMGDLRIDNRDHRGPNIELVWIPAGEFSMGSPAGEKGRSSSERLHKVRITKAFYIGYFEVTRHQYDWFHRGRVAAAVETGVKRFIRLKGKEPSNHERNQIKGLVNKETEALRKKSIVRGWDGKRWGRIADGWWNRPGFRSHNGSPVTCVSWTEAAAFCKWLSKQTSRTVRLPTEAEWEMACRAGTQTAYSFGDDPADLHKYGNYADKDSKLPESDKDHSDGQAFPENCGRRAENPWKLKDMHGNVAEWCADRWGVYRPGDAVDPTGPGGGLKRVVRGGSWFSHPKACRSAARFALAPMNRDTTTGFRVVVEIKN